MTGSNKGIGFALVHGLCKQWDGDVFVTARNEKRGKDSVEALQKEGLSPKFHQLDITDKASVVALRDFLVKTYGGQDILVNNAAIMYPASLVYCKYDGVPLSTLLALCERNPTVTTGFLHERPQAQNFDVVFIAGLNKLLKTHMNSGDLRRPLCSCRVTVMNYFLYRSC